MKHVLLGVFFLFLISNKLCAQHLFLLAGQSNANGQGDSKKSNLYSCDLAFEYDILLDTVKPLKDPAGQKWQLLEPANTGTILPAFTKVFTSITKQSVTMVTASRGGSSCSQKAELSNYDTWDEKGNLFSQAIEKTNHAIAKTKLQLNGIIWMQGERDANAINDGKLKASEYQIALIGLIRRFRKQYGRKLPFYIIQTGYQSARPKIGNDSIREVQFLVSKKLKHVFVVYDRTDTFFEKKWMKDNVHYNQEGLNDIGETTGAVIAKQHI